MVPLLITTLSAVVGYIVLCAYHNRKVFARLRSQGKPMPPFNWLFGHLLFLKSNVDCYPKDAVFNHVALDIARTTEHQTFYLDLWPFTIPALVVGDPHAADQIMRLTSIRKPQNVFDAFLQMSGGPNLVTMPEVPWKRWRAIFNPGFSSGYMLEQVPKLVDPVNIFCEKLRQQARSGEMFQLEEATFRLTIDVIGLITLDYHLDYQTRNSAFPATLRSLIETVSFGHELNPLARFNPIRAYKIWKWGQLLDAFLHRELEKRFQDRVASRMDSVQRDQNGKKVKSIAALALDHYITEDTGKETTAMDPNFKTYATANFRAFLVAGHDTTSSAITYTLHLLHKHSAFLTRVRAEHDAVFGTDISAAGALLKSEPSLLNQLPLTLAAIKESLRLFPPAGGIRMGTPNLTLTTEDGTSFPTAHCQVWILHEAIHRNPTYWPDPDAYIPERWLVGPDDTLYPRKGAWRAFETGPRNCIGQTLAMAEIKTVLVMVLREFDVKPMYEEWDAKMGKKGVKMVNGERVYQVSGGGGGPHPVDRYPCRVSRRCE